jgi:hypothetical protein
MVTINQIHMMPKKRSVWSNLSVPRYDQSLPTDLRGVFRTNYPRKILFSKTVTFKTAELPRWKPKNIIGLRTFDEKDA